jgi:lycopene cyclase domain-containing protein
MTYFEVLFFFVMIPIVILAGANIWHQRTNKPIKSEFSLVPPLFILGLMVLVAVVYTTPWDNYLVATSVWWYDLDLVTGIVIGWVPIEEYTFFVLQSVMLGLWVFLWLRYIPTDRPFKPNPSIRKVSVGLIGVLWVVSALILALGWQKGNYLGLELIWALPPIALQLAVGADILWHYRYAVFGMIATGTIYLCFVDSVGILSGTWTINPLKTTGIMVGAIPLEEALFFLLTNILLVGGLVLGLSRLTKARLPKGVIQRLPIG